MLVEDETGSYYVEVRRFSDDETSGIIIDELRRFLVDSTPHCRVDVLLPETLSLPANNHVARGIKQAKIREIIDKFKQIGS
ncbi:MAG: hypothetical protein ABSF09_06000 [Candidatus Bathyarchaeia archaeon]|jgi:hypothetical protein